MKIALLGYGKMGKAIETIALERGHEIVARINSQVSLEEVNWSEADVCIEFTRPELAPKHIAFCAQMQLPIVVGTTAWQDALPEVTEIVKKAESALLYASNFSVGVNLFFELNRQLAQLMKAHSEYQIQVSETHHVQKLDAPSGTAVSLLQDILAIHPDYKGWSLQNAAPDQIPVQAHRIPDVPGTHEITYSSEIDSIRIEHVAHNRKGFALGAVLAAEFIYQRKGIFTMSDVLKNTL
ncbi:MAG: 4-hydroxy-tetrahydrodipicolinate reductase [Flavobacteriia bacterium]|nr:4-hydroxy-tetrahydrodipicolinate reductase [Flavobacteriia bacterium]